MKDAKKSLRTLGVWFVLVCAFLFIFSWYRGPDQSPTFVDFSRFVEDAETGRLAEVWIHNNQITARLRSGERYFTLGFLDEELSEKLSRKLVKINFGEEEGGNRSLMITVVVVLAVLLALLYFLRKLRGGAANYMSIGKSKARLITEASKVTFADVSDCEEAKVLLGDVIDFLRNPARWAQAGVRLPRGVLLQGPPGCGKTLLARAVAGETNAHFYLTSASEFVEMFVGVGAARVRDTFDIARKNPPAVIFIDELDAVGRRRGSGVGASHDEREQTLNQLLVCLDGFEGKEPVVVIAATNRPDILDPALLRAGRFDRRIKIPELSCEGRIDALRIHTRNKKLAADVSLADLAERAGGFNGAQLENLANEAAVRAVRRSQREGQPVEVSSADFMAVLAGAKDETRFFDKLDAVLIESTTQLAEPTGKACVRLVLDGAEAIEGQVVWADSHFIKVRGEKGDVVVAKAQVQRIESLDGTEAADSLDVQPDRWSGRQPGVA